MIFPPRLPKPVRLTSWCAGLLLFVLCLVARATQPTLPLNDATPRIDAWPSLTWLVETGKPHSPTEAYARREQFNTPAGPRLTLGMQKRPYWLHLPLNVLASSDGRWVLDIDHPPLLQLDAYVLLKGQVVQHESLGSLRPGANRELRTLSHAVTLQLQPGQSYDLLIRVETTSASILPITLQKPASLLNQALGEQMLQGMLLGLALCLLAYSLLQWFSLRDPLFLWYVLMTGGSVWFAAYFHGVGSQLLWSDSPWLARHSGGLSAMVATCGGFLFISEILHSRQPLAWRLKLMRGGAVLACLLALAYGLDAFDSRAMVAIVTVLGPVPALIGIPGAWHLARRRDPMGATLLVAWAVYFASVLVSASIIQGRMPINFWTQHALQFGATLDMLLFMHVLGLRSKAMQQAAAAAHQERDRMRSLAYNDPLTGLPNRRGLHLALTHALTQCNPQRPLAVYLLDLDGFKPVNDRYGHDVGDELLVAVTRRLQDHLRQADLVARLGGDEFVVVAQVHSGQQAHDLGQKLLEAYRLPFTIGPDLQVTVGLTIGYAMAPQDGTDGMELLRLADAAMYAGKQSGKFCLRRCTSAISPA